jgi:hypothetical protein
MNMLLVSCGLRIHIKIILKVEFVHISWTYNPFHVPKWPNWAGNPVHRAKPISPWRARLLHTQSQGFKLLWYSHILIPELPNNAHSCICHGLAAASLISQWPGSIIPVQKHLLCWEYSVYLNVPLDCIIKHQGQSVNQERLLWIS